ncbi:MAG: HDIG domain-containing protein [Deltaproteobacteria bacterium]|nr:HDIG domain-containing protein [Deltaproteobacteria bacterium]
MTEKKTLSPARSRKRPAWRDRLGQMAAGMRPSRGQASFFVALAIIAILTVALSRPTPDNFVVGQKANHTYMCDKDQEVPLKGTDVARGKARDAVAPIFALDYGVGTRAIEDLRGFFASGRLLAASGQVLPGYGVFGEEFCRAFELGEDCRAVLDLVWRRGFDHGLEDQTAALAMEIMGQGIMSEEDHRGPLAGRDIEISRALTGTSGVSFSSILALPRARELVGSRTGRLGLDGQTAPLADVLARALLRPNLSLDDKAWEDRKMEAEAKVESIYSLTAGEIIVREGEIVSPLAGQLLEGILKEGGREAGLSIRPYLGLLVLLLVFLAVNQALIHLDAKEPGVAPREMFLISFLLLWFIILSWWSGHLTRGLFHGMKNFDVRTTFLAMPFPAAAMLGAIFLGLRRTVYICFLGAFLGAIATPQVSTLSAFIYTCNGCMVSIWGLRRISERSRFIPSAFLAALVNCLTMMALTLADGDLLSRQFLFNLYAAAISGLLSGILASGFVTFFEVALGLTTNLKLMELGNLNRPLLRELMLAAPGTYHHSVIVGNMVEAAAEAIGANPHLARVGAYYHDIGKISKPLYFIENQTGENKHETLTPTMSALVLVGHVKEGAELASKEKLPEAVIDIVEQHHGTSLMTYFFHKAKENRGPNSGPINEGDFRYPGPKPASKEAGLVMLADVCEAATRSLTEPTPSKIQELVKNLINRVFDDGQLESSELVLKDVTETMRIFNNILVGIYHHRIAYPGINKDAQNDQAAKSKVIYGQMHDEAGKPLTH